MYQFTRLKSINTISAFYFIAATIFFFSSKQLNAIETKFQINLLFLPAIVTDKGSEPVKGIRRENFTIFIDKAPHQVDLLKYGEYLPVSLTIALDVSGSMRAKFSKVRETLKAFLLQDTLKGEVSLLTFNDESQFIQDWTENRTEVINNLELLDTSKFKQTARLLDACNKSLIHFKNKKSEKKVILIITDSGDLNSFTKADELRRLCQEQNVVIHTIALFDSADDKNITTA